MNRKKNPFTLLVGIQTYQSNMEVSVETVLKKSKLEFLHDSDTPVLGTYLKQSKSPYDKDWYTSMLW